MSSNHKFESNKKYFTISIYTIAVILIGCVIFRFITQWSNTSKLISQLWEILFPFFMGFLIAYILNPVVAFFQRNVSIKLLKKKSASTQRGLAILISYLVMVGFIIVCLRFIIPQLYDSIRELSLMIPDIYKSIMSIFEHYRENSTDMFPGQIADMIETKTLPKLFELTNNLLTNIVPMLYEASMSFAKGLFNLFIAFIVSIYMTIDKFILKNAGKRLVLAIFNENFSYRVLRTLKDCHNIFSGFIIGKSIDSLIIGLLAFVAMTILKLPYTVLISVIIGVTNMIPYFGPIIGAVPGAFILFIVSPTPYKVLINDKDYAFYSTYTNHKREFFDEFFADEKTGRLIIPEPILNPLHPHEDVNCKLIDVETGDYSEFKMNVDASINRCQDYTVWQKKGIDP